MTNKDNRIKELMTLMKTNRVSFTFNKKNGEIRNAIGTLCGLYIPSELTQKEQIKLNKKSVDIILSEHRYQDIYEYASENNVQYIGLDGDNYVFEPISKKHNPDMIVYFDCGKQAFRSFNKENFVSINFTMED